LEGLNSRFKKPLERTNNLEGNMAQMVSGNVNLDERAQLVVQI